MFYPPMKTAMLSLALLVPFVFADNAGAACVNTTGGIKPTPIETIELTGPANAYRPGDRLGTSYMEEHHPSVFTSCNNPMPSGGRINSWVIPAVGAIPGLQADIGGVLADVYPTNVPGIGYAIGLADGLSSQYAPMNYPEARILGNISATNNIGFRIRAAYVATGPLMSGVYNIPPTIVGRVIVRNASDGTNFSEAVPIEIGGTRITVRAATCQIQNPNINVELPPVPVSRLSTPGAEAGDAGFDVNLRCDDSSINIHAVMTDVNDRSNTTSQLSLSPDSSAAGVALRVYWSSQPVFFGPDSPDPGTLNQWRVGNSGGGGNFQIPFTVKYARTLEAIEPGTVQAKATITMSYQ